MNLGDFWVVAAPVILGACGTLLLVREVYFAHRFEESSREMGDLRALLDLYHLSKREFAVRHFMFGQGLDRDKATQRISLYTAPEIDALADDAYRALGGSADAGLQRWNDTVKAQLRARRWLLLTGGGLLMLGFVFQLLADAKDLGLI